MPLGSQEDVRHGREGRDGLEFLVDRCHAVLMDLPWRSRLELPTEESDGAAGRLHPPAEDAQQGGLAGSVRPAQRMYLPAVQREAGGREYLRHAIGLADVEALESWRCVNHVRSSLQEACRTPGSMPISLICRGEVGD